MNAPLKIGSALLIAWVAGTTLPAVLLINEPSISEISVDSVALGISVFLSINLYAAFSVWHSSVYLNKESLQTFFRAISIPWAINVVLISIALVLDLKQ